MLYDSESGTTDLHSLQHSDSLEHLTGGVGRRTPPVAVTFLSSCLGNMHINTGHGMLCSPKRLFPIDLHEERKTCNYLRVQTAVK